VRQSLAIALGLVGTVPTDELEQDAVLTALLDECATGRSDATREFCFIALAEVGARDGAAPQHPRVHQALRDRLVRECVEPTVASDRAWAALSAAIYGRQQPDARAELADSLVAAWSSERDPSYKGAFALALGLIGADTRAGVLFGDWQDHQDQELNGFTALALGFMGYLPASEPLRELCQSRTITPLYRMRLATALALLADDGTDEALIGLIGEGHAVGVTAAAAKALGLVGGEPALAALRAIAGDKRQPVLARAFACVAVGMICEKTDLPWNARLAADCNFRQLVPTLREALEIL
jgi:HEAT repeat protein